MLHRMHDTPLETCSMMRCIACAAQADVSHTLFCPGPHLVRNEGYVSSFELKEFNQMRSPCVRSGDRQSCLSEPFIAFKVQRIFMPTMVGVR